MAIKEYSCKDKVEDQEILITFSTELGEDEDLDYCIEHFSKEAIYAVFFPAVRLRAQKAAKVIRKNLLANGTALEELDSKLQEQMATWKPSDKLPRVGAARKDPVEALLASLPTLSDERKAELVAQIQADLNVGKGSRTRR